MASKKKPAPPNSTTGHGGETHQQVPRNADHRDGMLHLTTNHGTRIADNQNSLRAGARGPTLLEDFILREKIFHFDHERIPERIVHARGTAAHGYFECTDPVPELTLADPFQEKGLRTPVFCRFSTVAGSLGSKDTPRDVRGFAVKFYTRQGNWDLVGNNIPVFFIQDAIKFPDLVHAVKPEADRGFPQAASAHDTFWDFVSLMPESMHMIMWAMSDRALPRSLRMMQGFGVHTFRLLNADGQSTFVKFHWKPVLGLQSTLWDEAVKISGADSDYHRRDLWQAITSGAPPEWELGLQCFDDTLAERLPYDVLDATKLIPEEEVPLRTVGRLVLDRWPDNFFAETEQVAFLPSNVIPGIDFSNDPLLQGRLFSYLDTQKSRLGTTNFHQIPINAPKCPMRNFQRDGMMQTQVPKGRANYEPNSLAEAGEDGGPRECPMTGFSSFRGLGERNDADRGRVRSERFADHYSQARLFWKSQTPIEQAHIASALVFELSKVELPHVRVRTVASLRNVDEQLAARVAAGLSMPLPKALQPARAPVDLPPSPALSIVGNMKPTLQGRSIGILFDEGSSKTEIDRLVKRITAAGARAMLIAPRVGDIELDGGRLAAEGQLAGSPSVLFDAVALVLTPAAGHRLAEEAAACDFVRDAWGHLKAIGHTPGAADLLAKAGLIEAAPGLTGLDDAFLEAAATRFFDREPKVRTLA
ncbi:MAG TPA: catalase [Burkholderiaceae bacterium]|nr:catalase [Burkholderiaceae bacterium]